MSEGSPDSIVRLFDVAARGDSAARDQLFTALYRELHHLAQAQLRRSGGQVTLSATTLIHEAYLGMAQRAGLDFPSRNEFLTYAARAMRGLIVDYVRRKRAVKRGGELTIVELDENAPSAWSSSASDLERVCEALDEVESLDPALAELVDLKFFCGFSFSEIAGIRGMSERTVQRDWAKARALLQQRLHE